MKGPLRNQAGQDIVEMALVFPLVALVLFAIVELGLIYYSASMVQYAARDGARYGILHPNQTANIKQEAMTRVVALNCAGGANVADPVITGAATDPNRTIAVTVTCNYTPIIGWVAGALGLPPSIPLTGSATMHIE